MYHVLGVSSADPDALERYASAGRGLNDSLHKRAQALLGQYQAYTANASDYPVDAGDVIARLTAYVDQNRQGDQWVQAIAAAFREADTGAGAGPPTLDDTRIGALLQAQGLPVSRSKEDWQRQALERAGIDPASWDPKKGLLANDETIQAVYRYYGQLYLDHPELQWAGMANLVGPMFYAGWQDLYAVRHIADEGQRIKYLSELLDLPKLPDWVYDVIDVTADLPFLLSPVSLAEDLVSEDGEWFEVKFLQMQKEIFEDLAWQHEAYLGGGIEELRRVREQEPDALDDETLRAWEDIDSGDPQRIARGNKALLRREQRRIVQDHYDEMRRHHGPVGEAFTRLLTLISDNPIPGGRPYRDVVTRTIGFEIDTPRVPLVGWDPPDPGVHVTLPRGNIADFDDRWEWIERDMLPSYRRLLADPDQMRRLVETPVSERAGRLRRLDDLPYPN